MEVQVVAVGVAVVLVAACFFLVRPALVTGLDYRVCDLLTAWAGGGHPSGLVTVVEIDEKSVAQYGRWPWPRDRLGLLVQRTLEDGAATVVLNAMFPEEDHGLSNTGGTNDAVLASSLAGHPTVIGYNFSFASGQPGASECGIGSLRLAIIGPNERAAFRASGALSSVAELSQAAASVGFLNSAPDSDGKLRRLPLMIECDDQYYPSLALAALNVYRHSSAMRLTTSSRGAVELGLDDKLIPLEGRGWLRLRFRGTRRTFPHVSAADIMRDSAPAERLRGKIAIIGGTASGLENSSTVPTDSLFPGVEIQATAIDNLLQGNELVWSMDPH